MGCIFRYSPDSAARNAKNPGLTAGAFFRLNSANAQQLLRVTERESPVSLSVSVRVLVVQPVSTGGPPTYDDGESVLTQGLAPVGVTGDPGRAPRGTAFFSSGGL